MDPALMYKAVHDGQVDVITAYTSDGRIEPFDLILLEDTDRVFPPYDAVLLVSAEAAARPAFIKALQPLVGAINLSVMQEANRQVDVKQRLPRKAAQLLLDRIERRKPGAGTSRQ